MRIIGKILIVFIVSMTIVATFILFPIPQRGFLFRCSPAFQNARNLKGASITFFMDPSFYYSFKLDREDFQTVSSSLNLEESLMPDFDLRNMVTHGPWFWNKWWWKPKLAPQATLYVSYYKGNMYYFLYNWDSEKVYLYIQNT